MKCVKCRARPACRRSKYNYCLPCRYSKLSQERFGPNNPNWKGDNVTYKGIHDYIKWHKPMPTRCENCKQPKSVLDLANISQEYLRDLSDWEWLCRRCHMRKDGRMKRFQELHKILTERLCRICGKHFMGVRNSVLCSDKCTKEAQREYCREWRKRCNMGKGKR